MMSSAESTAAQRVPAWKRLGLKLKQPTAASEPATGSTPAVGQPSSSRHKSHSSKRKLDAPPGPEPAAGVKKPRREPRGAGDGRGPSQKTPKPAALLADGPTKKGGVPAANGDTNQKQSRHPTKNKGPAKKPKPTPLADLASALQYLRQWGASRDSWKFNKNHQSALIKHVFDADGIPAADIAIFYEYIRDLKGFVRQRLRETAMEIRAKDAAEGASAPPAGTPDAEAKQVDYEKLLNDLLRTCKGGRKRKRFDEAGYVASSEDPDVVMRRVVKRMRAEMIIDELSDGEQTDDSRTTQSSGTMATSDTNTVPGSGADKKMRLNDGTGKRRRKLRVNMDDSSSSSSSSSDSSDSSSSSSSSSDSDSDSDTSSDGSSDDSDEEQDGEAQPADGHESSSSSSSSESESSSSDDESDSDEEESDDE